MSIFIDSMPGGWSGEKVKLSLLLWCKEKEMVIKMTSSKWLLVKILRERLTLLEDIMLHTFSAQKVQGFFQWHCHCLFSSFNRSKSISTAGIKDYTGGLSQYKPYRWNHVCSAVKYTSLGMEKRAERLIYVDGELNFNFTSAFLPETLWPLGNNFTFGGREFKHKSYHLDGWITDVQVYSKPLGSEEMIKFTLCHQVFTD